MEKVTLSATCIQCGKQVEVEVNKEDFKKLFDIANTDEEKAKSLCVHIQGMVFLYFIIKNKKNVSEIVTALVNGAKKISKTNSFFIKIY